MLSENEFKLKMNYIIRFSCLILIYFNGMKIIKQEKTHKNLNYRHNIIHSFF